MIENLTPNAPVSSHETGAAELAVRPRGEAEREKKKG